MSQPVKITMSSVAQDAGVSVSTVSRVLRGDPWVAAETADLVRRVAGQLGYKPRVSVKAAEPSAEELRLGLLLARPTQFIDNSPFFRMALSAISEAGAAEGGITVVRGDNTAAGVSRLVKDHSFDALLVLLSHGDARSVERISERLPVVWMLGAGADGAPGAGAPIDHVTTDNQAVGRLAFRALLERGCTRFVYLARRPDLNLFLTRARGFRAAACEAGLSDRVRWCFCDGGERASGGQFTAEFGPDVARVGDAREALGGGSHSPSELGVFIPSDTGAAELLSPLPEAQALDRLARAIVSVDNDSETLRGLHPRPLSIDLDLPGMARESIARLRQRVRGDAARPVLLQLQPRLPR